ncbi:MAG TPA: hypothetical protein VGY56_07465 [Verrucomicrobiae bacterium]|nr:hypothetical protein [Verrucomicrobiae bacterium]
MTKTCKNEDCAMQFDIPDTPFLSRLIPFCPNCASKRQEAAIKAELARVNQEREDRWKAICPPAYRETQIEKLPNPDKASDVLAWNYGPTGLLLHGGTRRGKSRCAWLLLRKVFDAGKSVRVLDSMAGFDYTASYAVSPGEAQAWVNGYSRCGLLFLDDIFKAKLTDSFESAIFAIVDHRLSHKLPILATLNDTGETLGTRMSADRGDAFSGE